MHLGGTLPEIAVSERAVWQGQHAKRPFVLLAQHTLFDPSRALAGQHTDWAYCHVPPGSDQDMTKAIEAQIERFAPGFRECVLARHTTNARQMQAYTPNYIGGDILGGCARSGADTDAACDQRTYISNCVAGGLSVFGVHATRRRSAWDVWLSRSTDSPSRCF